MLYFIALTAKPVWRCFFKSITFVNEYDSGGVYIAEYTTTEQNGKIFRGGKGEAEGETVFEGPASWPTALSRGLVRAGASVASRTLYV